MFLMEFFFHMENSYLFLETPHFWGMSLPSPTHAPLLILSKAADEGR